MLSHRSLFVNNFFYFFELFLFWKKLREVHPSSELYYTILFRTCQGDLLLFLKQFFSFFTSHKICRFFLILSIFCGYGSKRRKSVFPIRAKKYPQIVYSA